MKILAFHRLSLKVTDSKEKAEILNAQFKSVFTKLKNSVTPSISGNKYSAIGKLTISLNGVTKLLQNINVSKASGPDHIPGRLLNELSNEIAPVLHTIFVQSINDGVIPSDWRLAYVTPVFKKGNKNLAENYRPVSLTCITCKLMEHIIYKHILNHLESHNILSDLQHGFRSGRSCETQLITTIHDLMSSFDRRVQTDVAILDFSKAFDTVPHDRLLSKLAHYGIDKNIWQWISTFLKGRKQSVIVDGKSSLFADVDSGVPQGTVLGPLLFLLHINDLPSVVNSKVRLFADDCLLYREIKTINDQNDLQKDLNSLQAWASDWGMRFNAKKCNILTISRAKSPLHKFYSLCGEILKEVPDAKYLGIQIDSKLAFSKHISMISARGNSNLAFLRRNLKSCPSKLRDTAYRSLVRPSLEYSCSVWSPFKKIDGTKLEKVQRRAARFVTGKYKYTDSVSEMLQSLGWPTLEARRKEQRLVLFYKIVNKIACIQTGSILAPADSRTRANHRFKFAHVRTNCESFRHSFFPATISDWNSLPFGIVEAETTDGFKLKYRSHQASQPEASARYPLQGPADY